jgi:hypothetical protein
VRRLATICVAFAVFGGVRAVLGPMAAAVLAGGALVAVVIAALAALDAWPSDRRHALPRSVIPYRPAPNELDHAAFARALAGVAAAYLTACEREDQP